MANLHLIRRFSLNDYDFFIKKKLNFEKNIKEKTFYYFWT